MVVSAFKLLEITSKELGLFTNVSELLGAFAFSIVTKHDNVVLLLVMGCWLEFLGKVFH